MIDWPDKYRPMVRIVDPAELAATRSASTISLEARQRESRAIRLALTLLGHDRAEALLQNHHPELGGRPISIAADSPDGAAAVERLIMLARQQDESFTPTDQGVT